MFIRESIMKVILKIKPPKNLELSKYVLVETFNGRTIGGNPYYLGKYIANEENIPLVVSTNNIPKIKEKNTNYIKRREYNFEHLVNNATFLIVNNDIYVKNFNPKGFFIQTWHGTPLKKIGRDIQDWKGIEDYICRFEDQLRKAHLLLAQNDYSKEVFKTAFNNIKEAEVTGYPKNDFFFQNHDKLKIKLKEKLGIENWQKVILYAPT